MRTTISGLLAVLFIGFMFCGCAKKEAVKADEAVVPAAVVSPEPPASVPEQPKPAQQPESTRVEVAREAPEKAMPVETVQKMTLETIYFDFDKSDLRKPDRDILARNAAILMGPLKKNVQIEGHCDERGSAEYNLALGERRARSAMKYLIMLGVSADRLSIISYGKEKPVDPGHDEEAWAKNRRAQFVIMGE